MLMPIPAFKSLYCPPYYRFKRRLHLLEKPSNELINIEGLLVPNLISGPFGIISVVLVSFLKMPRYGFLHLMGRGIVTVADHGLFHHSEDRLDDVQKLRF